MKKCFFLGLLVGILLGFREYSSQPTTGEMIIKWDVEGEGDDLVVMFWEKDVDGQTRLLDNWTGKNLKVVTPDGDHLQVPGKEISVIIHYPPGDE